MELKNFTYLLLLVASFIIPFIYSFEKQVRFYTKFKYLVPGILFSGAIFILWDIRFEELGIWQFNPDYLLGIYLLNLPVEEWLFFFVIPYCCLFIYEVIKLKLARFNKPNLFLVISLVLLVAFALTAYFARTRLYTFFTFFLLTIYFGYTIFRNRFKQHLTHFYLTWAVSLVAFLIVNGVLTALPVVEYNDMHNLGIRIFTIPIEDAFYLFLMLIMNITIYEYAQAQRIISFSR